MSSVAFGAVVSTLFICEGGCGKTSPSAGTSSQAGADGGPGADASANPSLGDGAADGPNGAIDGATDGTADGAAEGSTATGATTASKVDILFDIDNSSSMGDKQQYLQAAIPSLITRLVTPNCVDPSGNALVDASGNPILAGSSGQCAPSGSGIVGKPAFAPVNDMHVGVITSSLGPRGTTSICQIASTTGAVAPDYEEFTTGSYETYLNDSATDDYAGLTAIPKNNDDQGHLINRTDPPSTPSALPTASTSVDAQNVLAWYPSAPENGVTSAAILNESFQDLVVGAQAFGCGIESQLESWYRFLVQPDPYFSITTTKNSDGLPIASWSGVDITILQQRADFLRPDSLVLIVVLSDENDSEIDVRTIGGIGVNWLDADFQPPRGTSECATDPGGAACTSCAFNTAPTDSQCETEMGVYEDSDPPNWAYNDNLRHVHMKAKYGLDLQFPINRYVVGLSSQTVPNRSGEYPAGAMYYQGGLNSDPADLNCVNPLFATNLPTTATGPDDPTICNLTPNTVRTPASNLVYYAHIGGVPHELLTETSDAGTVTVKETLAPGDWQAILGQDPENFNYAGIDPHMIESYQPRPGIGVQGSDAGAAIVDDEGPDWVTDGTSPQRVNLPVDREYACIFRLVDANGNPAPRNCDPTNTSNSEADISQCDCSTAGLAPDAVPSVCDPTNNLLQDYAKVYPTIRELLLAEKLGSQGIVSSMCPIDLTDNAAGDDRLYGYRPAITTIVDRVTPSLAGL
jgi:hypothetical protein